MLRARGGRGDKSKPLYYIDSNTTTRGTCAAFQVRRCSALPTASYTRSSTLPRASTPPEPDQSPPPPSPCLRASVAARRASRRSPPAHRAPVGPCSRAPQRAARPARGPRRAQAPRRRATFHRRLKHVRIIRRKEGRQRGDVAHHKGDPGCCKLVRREVKRFKLGRDDGAVEGRHRVGEHSAVHRAEERSAHIVPPAAALHGLQHTMRGGARVQRTLPVPARKVELQRGARRQARLDERRSARHRLGSLHSGKAAVNEEAKGGGGGALGITAQPRGGRTSRGWRPPPPTRYRHRCAWARGCAPWAASPRASAPRAARMPFRTNVA